MKIAYLAARNVIHTVRWVNALAQRGHRIFLITMHAQDGDPLDERVQVFRLPVAAPWGYFFNSLALVKLLRQLQPDILHVHLGMAGRQYVMEQYEWENCVDILEGIYANTKY